MRILCYGNALIARSLIFLLKFIKIYDKIIEKKTEW